MSQPPAGPSYGQDPNQGPGQYPGQYPGQQGPGQQYGQSPYSGQPGGYPPPGQPYGNQPQGGYPYGGQPAQPAYGSGGSASGGYPAPGAGGGGKAPKEVETSFKLWLAAIAVSLIGSIIAFLSLDAITDAALGQSGLDPAALTPDVTAAARVGAIIGAVIGLLILALQVAVVFQMRKGRNWARILLAVLGGLSVLFGLLGLFSAGTTLSIGALGLLSLLLSIVQMALIVAAILFMFRGAANPYFGARR